MRLFTTQGTPLSACAVSCSSWELLGQHWFMLSVPGGQGRPYGRVPSLPEAWEVTTGT